MFDFLTNAFDFSEIFKTITTRWYYYVALAAFSVIIFSFFFFKKQPAKNSLTKTQRLCYVAVLAALSTVTNIYSIPVSEEFQISLVATIGFVAGYSLGGGYGFAVCFIGDLIAAIVHPFGPYNPIIGIGTGLWGLIPGVAFSYFRGNDYVKTAVSFALGFLLISAGINLVGFCLMYPSRYTFAALLPTLPLKFAVAAINFSVCAALIPAIPRIMPKAKFYFEEKKDKCDNNLAENQL